MGFTPAEVGAMSLWQYNCAWSAFVAAKTGEQGVSTMTEDDFEAAASMI
ncbi:hypothetical protein [Labrys sp. (in: a-proteobacteria)]